MNIPNYLTVFRIVLIPIFVVLFYIPTLWCRILASVIFAIAAFTDWLDGYFARRWAQSSSFGQFLDPVADKLLVVTALVLLVADRDLPYLSIPVAVIAGREIVVSALREWVSELGQSVSLRVSYLGKVKAAVQMVSIIILLLYHAIDSYALHVAGYVSIYLAMVLTLLSMFIYLQIVLPMLLSAKSLNSN